MSATEPEEPFSGETIPIDVKRDPKKMEKLIEASRKNYANIYRKPEAKQVVKITEKVTKNDKKRMGKTASKKFTPDAVEE